MPALTNVSARTRRLAAAAALVATLGGVASARATHPSPPASPTIVVGSVLSLTGSGAARGRLLRDAYALWADQLNARGGVAAGGRRYRIAFITRDEESNTLLAAELATRIINEDHAQFLLGPSGADETFAVAGVAERKTIPLVAAAPTTAKTLEQGYRFFFSLAAPARRVLDDAVTAAVHRDRRIRSVAFAGGGDDYSRELLWGARAAATRLHLRIIEGSSIEDRHGLRNAALRASRDDADLVVAAGTLAQIVTLRAALFAAGGTPRATLCAGEFDGVDLRATLGPQAVRMLTAGPRVPAAADRARAAAFARDYALRTHQPVRDIAATGAAAGAVLEEAIHSADTLNVASVRRALSVTHTATVAGPVRFDDTGENIAATSLLEAIEERGIRVVAATSTHE